MKFTVKNMTRLSMFIAIAVVLGYVRKFFPELPQGGTLSIEDLSILLCAYLMGWEYGIVCGVGVCALQFAFGQALFYGPWSVVLDYLFPLAFLGVAALVKNKDMKSFILMPGIILAYVLKFASNFCSGAFLFAAYAPVGMNPLVYSFVYNLPYNLVTLIAMLILVPIFYKRLKPVFKM